MLVPLISSSQTTGLLSLVCSSKIIKIKYWSGSRKHYGGLSWSKVQLGEGEGRHPGGHPHQPGRQGEAVVGPEVELQDQDLRDGHRGGHQQGQTVVHTSQHQHLVLEQILILL